MTFSREQVEDVLQQARQHLNPVQCNHQHWFLSVESAARYLRGLKTVNKAAQALAITYQYRSLVDADDLGVNPAKCSTVWNEMHKRGLFIASLTDGADPPSPVLVLRKREEPFDPNDFEDYRRTFFFILDCTQRIADKGVAAHGLKAQTGQWVVVLDMQSYKSGNSPPLSATTETIRILQRHFPERAKHIIFLDAPRVFSLLWVVVRPLLDPVTRAKIVFMNRSDPQFSSLSAEIQRSADMDLDEGKRHSAELMIQNGFLVTGALSGGDTWGL